jgi:ABC-type Na+ transport system ATPase subunit NatA
VAPCEEDSTGKSTLLNIIAGVITPDSGDVWIDGHSLIHAPNNCLAFPTQTGRGLLEQVAAEKNVALDEATLGLAYDLGLEPHLDKRFEQVSTGTRRKMFVTAAALGDPAVVIADGPSNGSNARGRAVLAELSKAWGKDRVVLFASHDGELVEGCGAGVVDVAALR